MAIIVGSVGVSVTPDVTGFAEKLRAPLLKVADSIGAQVGQIIGDRIAGAMPGAGESAGTRFSDTFKARVDAALAKLPDATVDLNDTAAQGKLEELRTRLAALSASVGVDIDPTEALVAMRVIRAELDALGARSPKIDVQVDIARASAELATLTAEIDALAGSGGSGGSGVRGLSAASGDASKGFSNLVTAGLTLGPALIPIVGAATVGVAALAAGFVAAGAGVGAFGALAIPTIKDIQSGVGPAGQALAGLTDTYKTLVAAIRPDVLGSVTLALGDAARILPNLLPLAKAAAAGIDELLGSATTFEPIWNRLTTAFAGSTAQAISNLGGAFLGLVTGIAGVIAAFLPLADQILPHLNSAMASFAQSAANLGQSQGFQSFLAYVQDNGPRVLTVFSELGGAVKNLVVAFAPIGTVVLVALEGLLDVFDHIPVPLITAAAVAVTALAVSLKAVSLYNSIGTSLGKLGAAAVPIGIAGLAVGLLGSYVSSAYQRTQQADQATKAYFQTLATLDPSKYASFSDLTLGLNAQRLALQAVIGEYDAYKAHGLAAGGSVLDFSAKLDAMKGGAADAQAALDKLNASAGNSTQNIAALAAQFGISQDRVLSLAQSNKVDLTGALGTVKVAFGAVYDATTAANSAAGQLTAAQKILADSSQTAAAKADALSSALALQAGDSISATVAQNNLTVSVQNDATAFDAHSRSLNANSAAGAANQNVLLQQIQMAEQTAEAQAKAGDTLAVVSTQYGANTAAIAANAIKNGANAAEVQNLIGKYQQLPPQVTTLIHADTDPAKSAVATFAQQLPTSLNAAARQAGIDAAEALAGGINYGSYAAALAASKMAAGVMDAINRKLDRQSPPKEIIKIGKDIGPALAIGIAAGATPVTAAARALADSVGVGLTAGGFGLSLPSVTMPVPIMTAAPLSYNGMGSLQTLAPIAQPGYASMGNGGMTGTAVLDRLDRIEQHLAAAPALTGAAVGDASLKGYKAAGTAHAREVAAARRAGRG